MAGKQLLLLEGGCKPGDRNPAASGAEASLLEGEVGTLERAWRHMTLLKRVLSKSWPLLEDYIFNFGRYHTHAYFQHSCYRNDSCF